MCKRKKMQKMVCKRYKKKKFTKFEIIKKNLKSLVKTKNRAEREKKTLANLKKQKKNKSKNKQKQEKLSPPPPLHDFCYNVVITISLHVIILGNSYRH